MGRSWRRGLEFEKDGSVKDKFGNEMDKGYTEHDEGEGMRRAGGEI